MDHDDDEHIAQIVMACLHADHEAEAERKAAARKTRHFKRRLFMVVTTILAVVLTHHYTHIEPVGKIGELGAGAFISWLFEKGAASEV